MPKNRRVFNPLVLSFPAKIGWEGGVCGGGGSEAGGDQNSIKIFSPIPAQRLDFLKILIQGVQSWGFRWRSIISVLRCIKKLQRLKAD